jgi:hypothetical protein
MKILILALSATLGLATAAPIAVRAQPATPPAATPAPSPDALQAARDLFGLVSGNMISDITTRMTAQLWPSIQASLRARNPQIDDATLVELRQQFEKLIVDYVSDVMKDAPAIYAKYFTAQEMRDIIVFYKTPTGAKALKVMPQASADFFGLLVPRLPLLQQKVAASFQAILQKRGFSLR